MNLLRAVGTLMQGKDIKNIKDVVYGDITVLHVYVDRKTIQRPPVSRQVTCLDHMIVSDVVHDSPQFATLMDQSHLSKPILGCIGTPLTNFKCSELSL